MHLRKGKILFNTPKPPNTNNSNPLINKSHSPSKPAQSYPQQTDSLSHKEPHQT